MDGELSRELTALEYVVLGFISRSPQSGYSIINFLEDGMRWSASPGSVYPMLKRLESQAVIEGELENIYETRPRKVYTLTPLGERLLDAWVRTPMQAQAMMGERYTMLQKFLFAEHRLTRDEIVAWLDECDRNLSEYQQLRAPWDSAAMGEMTLHQQLLYEATIMDINTIRTWLHLAKGRVLNRRD